MDDLISRQAAIGAIMDLPDCPNGYSDTYDKACIIGILEEVPSAQPDVPDANVGDINKFIDGFVEIFADIRERNVDDSVCGLCEYDGAYIGESGDWCNECPGFNRDDCFKLRDGIRKKWIAEITACMPSVQPERPKGTWIEGNDDLISCHCSACGWEAHLYEDDVFGMPYCPNCGAMMVRGEEHGLNRQTGGDRGTTEMPKALR